MQKEENVFVQAFTSILSKQVQSNGNINLNYVLEKIYQHTSRGAELLQEAQIYRKYNEFKAVHKNFDLDKYVAKQLDY